MHDQYQNHTAEELGRIAHEGTLRTRQAAIAELVNRAKCSGVQNKLMQNTLVAAYGRVEALEGKLRRIRAEASA